MACQQGIPPLDRVNVFIHNAGNIPESYIEMLEAASLICEDLKNKVNRIAENSRKYVYLWEH